MIIGIFKEIKTEEDRVSMVPAGVGVMLKNGHHILAEKGAGSGRGFEDTFYI
jgi:alanine dehydrogenase